jgi:hypothetical protein
LITTIVAGAATNAFSWHVLESGGKGLQLVIEVLHTGGGELPL